jgi:hypothetical protein
MLPAMISLHRHRWLSAAALAVTLSACGGPPPPVQYESGGRMPATTADGLHRVRATRVGAAYLKPGASFAGYDAILIAPVTIAYQRGAGGHELDGEERERMERMFQEAFQKQLGRSKSFAVVSEPGPSVLRVAGHIVDLVVTAPPFRGGEVDFVMDAGELTLILDVRDSESHEALARVADKRAIRPEGSSTTSMYRSGPVNNWGALREIFDSWARLLRGGLDDLHTLPQVPPLEAMTPG